MSTDWINIENGQQTAVQLNTGHILQALIGTTTIPHNLINGLIMFDHTQKNLSSVNTCAPSISFSDVTSLQKYENFETHFLNIVVGAYGFGNV